MPKFKCKKKEFEVPSGSELLELARKNREIGLKFGCTRGECGVCAVKVLAGGENLSKQSLLEVETLRKKGLGEGYRLACQCALNGNLEVE